MQTDEWKEYAAALGQAFVAMWRNPGLEGAWKAMRQRILGAGYKPLQIDTRDDVNKICDDAARLLPSGH